MAIYDQGNRVTSITLNPASATPTNYTLTYDSHGNLAEKRNSVNNSDVTTYGMGQPRSLVATNYTRTDGELRLRQPG